jgi:lipopolysaccharide/colanic/teichoic acid biosynthesis glycosyltransferase
MLQDFLPVDGVKTASVHKSAYCVVKRSVDLVGGLVGLLGFAVVYLPVAIAIKLESPGPIFYSQVRCGLRGRPFTLYKFRSMVRGADSLKHLVKNESVGHLFKNSRDPRVTRVGRFLRKTSLDEMPQFWNVLRGEMSLVGTRPPTLDEVECYNSRHLRRLAVRPGMTGEWQVRGRSTIKDFEAVVDLDLRYQELWTPWYDLRLIFRTFWILLQRSGAY